MKNERRLFVMFLANTLLLVFLAPVSSHAFFQEVKSEFRYQGASVWQAVLDPLATLFEPWFQTSPKGTLIPTSIEVRENQEEKEQKEVLIVNNPQTLAPSKQEILSWIKDILKLQNTETYTSSSITHPPSVPLPSLNLREGTAQVVNQYITNEYRTSGSSQGLADSLSQSLTNIDNRFTQITNTLTNSYTFLSPSLTNATLTGETTIDSHLLMTATSAPSITTNRLYNTGGDLYWAGSLIGGATTGNWTSDGTNVWRSGGNVGVGTSTPDVKLLVAGTHVSGKGLLQVKGIGSSGYISATTDSPTTQESGFILGANTSPWYMYQSANNSDISFYFGGAGAGDKVRITAGGNLGIGTTTPFASLSVNNIAGTPGFVVGSTTATSFIVDKNGRVGVGTTAPSQLLSVGATNQFTVTGAGAVVAAGTVSANLFNYTGGNADILVAGGLGVITRAATTEIQLTTNSYWQTLTAYTNGTEKMRITSAGNLGIGSTTPWGLLSVNANGLAAGTPQFVVGSSTATNFIVANGGNVGVGTVAPAAELHISNANAPSLNITDSDSGSGVTATDGLALQVSGVEAYLWNYESGSLNFATNNTSRMRISSGGGFSLGNGYTVTDPGAGNVIIEGSVGIGTVGPTNTLDVYGGATDSSSLRIHSNSVTTGGLYGYSAIANAGVFSIGSEKVAGSWIARATSASLFGADTTDSAAFYVYANTGLTGGAAYAPSEVFRITTAGNVGVGTTSPSAKLSVKGGGTTTGRAFAISDSADVEKFTVLDNGNVTVGSLSASAGISIASGYVLNFPGTGYVDWYVGNLNFRPGGAVKAYINTDGSYITQGSIAASGAGTNYLIGNTGIATTSPWRTLSVAGTAAFSGLVNDSTGYYACVNTTTGQLATSTTACGASSERFKENIQDLSYGLSEVLSLRPVSFDYKDSYIKDSTHQLGFIAEEVDLLIPELVARDVQGQIQGLDYPKFTSVIVKAIQELSAKVDTLMASAGRALSWFTEDGKLKVQNDICVDDTCVTKDQFKQLLLNAAVGATQTVGSENLESGIQEEENQSATTTEEIASSTPTADFPDSDPLLHLGEGGSAEADPGEVVGEVLEETATTTPE